MSLSCLSLDVKLVLCLSWTFGAAILMLQKRMSEDMKDLSGSFHLHIRYSSHVDDGAVLPLNSDVVIGIPISAKIGPP